MTARHPRRHPGGRTRTRPVTWAARGRAALALALLAALAVAGCGARGSLIESASLSAAAVDASGDGSPALLRYALSRPAAISLDLVGADGARYRLRQDEPRPAGSYEVALDGTYPLPDDPEQRRTLPGGDYQLLLTASGPDGPETRPLALRVERPDRDPPRIENLAVYPAATSPNFDGVDDVAHLSYRLSKPARVYAYVQTQDGGHLPLEPRALHLPGEYALDWDGTQAGKPVADGSYQAVVRAEDNAGNVAVARTTITVQSGGQPEARVLRVEFSPRQLMVGDTLHVAVTVKNTGTAPLRTQGPDPGFVYDSYDSFASIAGHQYVDRAGMWRVGVDWAGSPTTAGAKYAYRWGFGRDLKPGEEITVEGGIRILHGPDQDAGHGPPQDRLFLYAGLIHEGFAFQEDKVGGVWIQVGY